MRLSMWQKIPFGPQVPSKVLRGTLGKHGLVLTYLTLEEHMLLWYHTQNLDLSKFILNMIMVFIYFGSILKEYRSF